MRVSFLLSIIGVAAAFVAVTPHAVASEFYPQHMQEKYGMACVPQCTLCHSVNPGVQTTATQKFSIGPLNPDNGAPLAPLYGESTEALDLQLAKPERVGLDSDGDTIPDEVELMNSTNPNVPGAETLCGQTTQFGCGATIARHAKGARAETGAAALMLGLLGLLSFRRRSRALE
jgi:hypothetical protein